MDINVLPVWRKGITGKGVVVSILDDGRSSSFHLVIQNMCEHHLCLCLYTFALHCDVNQLSY